MICPDCDGTRRVIASHVRYGDGSGATNVSLRCSRCIGKGVVPDEMAEWIRVGQEMRKSRLAIYRTLRQEALRRGMTAMQLSQMEHGKILPIPE